MAAHPSRLDIPKDTQALFLTVHTLMMVPKVSMVDITVRLKLLRKSRMEIPLSSLFMPMIGLMSLHGLIIKAMLLPVLRCCRPQM